MMQRFYDFVRFGRQLTNGWRVNHERWIADLRRDDIAPYTDGTKSLIVLDLANGQLRPQYFLLKAAGHRVYGIDIINRRDLSLQRLAYELARWIYKKQVAKLSDNAETLTCGNVGDLPFRKNNFDLVTSVAAFEHFLDVPKVMTEIYRVLRPGGLAWVLIHVFSSLSGGHNIGLAEVPLQTVPNGVDPWDHLRARRLSFHVPLNQWRINQYLMEFQKRFDVLEHYCAMREGEHLLTPEIENDLPGFSRDELTCVAYVILVRKSGSAI